jgi:hypothetical protein
VQVDPNEGERQVVEAADADRIAASVDLDRPSSTCAWCGPSAELPRPRRRDGGADPDRAGGVREVDRLGRVGHGADILIPPHVAQPDYEGELAVVIGRRP